MVRRIKCLFLTGLVLALLPAAVLSQNYPNDYIAPVRHPIRLSGTFGELRTSHFHMGIDIKSSNGGEGDPILAVQDGFISRIRVQAGGYGNVLYIDHPDGWTSVYAHLSAFSKEISEFVESFQYREERFEVDVAPPDTLFRVKKGDVIGKMGNTGWSFGPHLHFELRRTSTEVAHNPLHLGYDLQDQKPPSVQKMLTYLLDPKLRNRGASDWKMVKNSDHYSVVNDTVKLAGELSGIGIVAYDQMDMTHNRNGIYRMEAWVDETPLFGFAFDSIDFENSRRIETHMDHRWMAMSGEKAHRCYKAPADELSIYMPGELSGLIKLYADRPAGLRVRVSDFSGNQSEVKCWLQKGQAEPQEKTYQRIIPWDRASDIITPGFRLHFPAKAVAEDLFLFLEQGRTGPWGVLDTFYFGAYDDKPIRNYEVSIPLPKADSLQVARWTLLWESQNGTLRNLGGEIAQDSLVVSLDRFGKFILTQDTIPPRIRPVRIAPSMSRNQQIIFEISDNWDVSGNARELRYRATMNGEWVLFTYDLKKRRISFRFPKKLKPGTYDFDLTVWDDRDNESTFQYQVRLRD